jgi:glyoxylase-like metal-dependent hydrolase (beta-lactamase superfamily II)
VTARIADGVHRCGTELVNWYVVEEDGRLTIVDCGSSGYWPQLDRVLAELGRTRDDIHSVVLTHGHVDHVGFAERLRAESGVPVWVHEGDEEMVRTGKFQDTEGRLLPYLRYPFAFRMLSHLARNGPKITPVKELRTYADGHRFDGPGQLVAVHAPGHSLGMCALHHERADLLFTGDGVVMRNPLTGRRGPQIPPKAFNVNSAQALASLDRLPQAAVLVSGHGDPWTEGTAAAVERARAMGVT